MAGRMVRKIVTRLMLLVILLIIMNAVYTKWFYEKDIQKNSPVINLVRAVPQDADVVYVGESSNNTNRSDDLDPRPISDFIADYYQDLKLCDITKPAAHAGIFYVLLKEIPKSSKVKTVIVTLNLRSFNAQWIYSRLETQLQKSIVLLKDNPPLLNRFILSFKAYDNKNDKERDHQVKSNWKREEFQPAGRFQFNNVIEWDHWMAQNGIRDENGKYDNARTILACHYIKTYAFQIDTLNNPRIRDFDKIISLAKRRGWNLVFNLMAENTEKAEELVGDELIDMIHENASLLVDYFSNKGVTVVNNIDAVGDEQYIDRTWTTEHYAEKGRKTIARNVAMAMKKWYNNDFQEVEYSYAYETEFFNNCDSGTVWGQMQTVTSDLAHSGKKSSMTGSGNDFSITLEYPIKMIPDSLKNQIDIDFWAYQTSLNHEAKLVIEANGYNFDYFWNGIDVKPRLDETMKWEHFSDTVMIPDSIKHADVFKVYVYNPSNVKLYVDDFSIKFH